MQPEMAAFYKSSVPTAILLPFLIHICIHFVSVIISGYSFGLNIITFACLGVFANGSLKPLFCQIDCTC